MRIHPGGFRLVLAGPKVARLLPFLEQKGFVGEAFTKGSEALNRMRQSPCHLLLLELECGDTMGVDLARGAKQEGITAAVLLVDDPMKSGMIISALARGIDSYVAIPPDEAIFFSRIENVLLAQYALVMTQQQSQLTDEIARLQKSLDDAGAGKAAGERKLKDRIAELEKQVTTEQKRVADLDRESAVLREQLTTMHLVTGAKTGLSDEGGAVHSDEGDEQVDFLLDDEPVRPPPPKPLAKIALRQAPAPKPTTTPTTTTTTPMPAPRAAIDDELDGFANIVRTKPAAPSRLDSFEESTQDIPASIAKDILGRLNTAPVPAPPRSAKPSPAPMPPPTVARPAVKGATVPSMPAVADTGLDELAHFDVGGPPDVEQEPPEFTMAMPGDVARSLLAKSSITSGNLVADTTAPVKRPAAVDDARTVAMSADVARALVKEAGSKPSTRPSPAPIGDEAPTLAMQARAPEWSDHDNPVAGTTAPVKRPAVVDDAPTLAPEWSDHTDNEFDAPTAAVPIGTPLPPKRPPTVPLPLDDFDEPTPAVGFGKAASLPRSMGVSSGEGRGFDGARRGARPPVLDSQVVRDLAGIPSLDNEEILFVDDD